MKRCAIYARVSMSDQRVDNQLYDLRQFAAQRGLEIIAEYTDVGISGSKARRPGLDATLRDARKRKFTVLIVAAFDRLARSTKHFLGVVDELDSLSIEFISKRENIETSGAMGRLFITLISSIAELEADLIKERVRAGIRRRKLEGLPVGRQPLDVDREAIVTARLDGHEPNGRREAVRREPCFGRAMGSRCPREESSNVHFDSNHSRTRGGGGGLMKSRVIVRCKQPSGAERKKPSAALNRLMVSLADTDEMRPLLYEASREGKALVIDMFQNRKGHPILVHFSKESVA
jgi:DNA invertase Pin-like site-specific DNA recombinase